MNNHQSETSAISKRSTQPTSREKIILSLILRSKADCGLNQPNAKEIEFIKRSWFEALSDIPDAWLERSYVVAIKDHQNGPFGVSEICQGWQVVKESEAYKRLRELMRSVDKDQYPETTPITFKEFFHPYLFQ